MMVSYAWLICIGTVLVCRGRDVLKEDFIMQAIVRESGQHYCLGAIIASQAVLTSCTCIGKFAPETGKYFKFLKVGFRDLYLRAYQSKAKFEIMDAFIHAHCRPSEWESDVFVYNLGAWRTTESIDMSTYSKLAPPPFTDEQSDYASLYPKLQSCFVYAVGDQALVVIGLQITSDMGLCVSRYCKKRKLDRLDKCPKVLVSTNAEAEVCAMVEWNIGLPRKLSFTGSPVVCSFEQDFSIFGVIADVAGDHTLWSRLDKTPNSAFYNSTIDSASTFHFNILAIILILCIVR